MKKIVSILAAVALLIGSATADKIVKPEDLNPCIPCERIKIMCCNWLGADFCEEQAFDYISKCWRDQYARYCRDLLANYECMMGPEEFDMVMDYLHTECPHKKTTGKPGSSKCNHEQTTCTPSDKNHHDVTCTKCGAVMKTETCTKQTVSSYADHTSDGRSITTYEKRCTKCKQYSWSYVN